MNEKEMLELMKNCFSGSSQDASCCGPSAGSFDCCGSPETTKENKKTEKEN